MGIVVVVAVDLLSYSKRGWLFCITGNKQNTGSSADTVSAKIHVTQHTSSAKLNVSIIRGITSLCVSSSSACTVPLLTEYVALDLQS